MRLRRNCSHTSPGRYAFIAQVHGSWPVAPNFIAGHVDDVGHVRQRVELRRDRAGRSGSSRCPDASRLSLHARVGEARDADDATLDAGALGGAAAIRASVGPILPPTPRTIRSPSIWFIARTAESVGSLSRSSSFLDGADAAHDLRPNHRVTRRIAVTVCSRSSSEYASLIGRITHVSSIASAVGHRPSL